MPIIDAGGEQMISLDHEKKEATITDMTKIATELAKIPSGEVTASLTPTTQTRQIAGANCTVHDMKISVPFAMGKDQADDRHGRFAACLVKGAPGAADFAAFYKAFAEKNLFMGDPRAAKGQPGQQRASRGCTRRWPNAASPTRLTFSSSSKGRD